MEKITEKVVKDSPRMVLRRSAQAFCFVCQKPVNLLTFQQTAEHFETDIQSVYFLTQRAGLHLLHNRKGEVMVCEEVVLDVLHKRQMRIEHPQIITLKPLN